MFMSIIFLQALKFLIISKIPKRSASFNWVFRGYLMYSSNSMRFLSNIGSNSEVFFLQQFCMFSICFLMFCLSKILSLSAPTPTSLGSFSFDDTLLVNRFSCQSRSLRSYSISFKSISLSLPKYSSRGFEFSCIYLLIRSSYLCRISLSKFMK